MALTRRGLGLGLLATGIGGTAGVAWLGPERIKRFVTGAGPDPVTLWGFIGGEKVDFVRNPRVRDLLSRRYGLTLDARRAGSIEMVGDPALTGQRPHWVWPANFRDDADGPRQRAARAARRDRLQLASRALYPGHRWSPPWRRPAMSSARTALIPIGKDADRWSASLRPADDRRPAVAGAISDELSSSPIGITSSRWRR